MTGFHFQRFIRRKHYQLKRKRLKPPEKLSKWKYLHSVKSEITQTDDIEIGMLIGDNCMKVSEPLKVVPSKDGGPYSYPTKPGWCICGPIQNVGHQNSLKFTKSCSEGCINWQIIKASFPY